MRVSDNTSKAAVNEAIRRGRGRMEELQLKNATQKRLVSAADDPAAHSKIMDIRTQATVNKQFEDNAALAKNRLVMTDNALSELYDIFTRAKEIAIGQSSEASANADSRLGVAQEVSALYKQLVGTANRRIGEQYLFGGFKTLTPPYTADGEYMGDHGEIPVEIQKDVYISANVPGSMVFETKRYLPGDQARSPAAVDKTGGPGSSEGKVPRIEKQMARPVETVNIFHELDGLRVGLLTNDTATIRDSLDKLDEIIKNIITLRSKVSSRVAGIDNALGQTSKIDQANAELLSQLEDADYTELWSNLAREESVMRSSLQAAQKLIQPTLLDFLR